MIWSFMAVLFSGWLYVDASYRGPQWQRWLFKPITLILLLALAWQAPVLNAMDYLILGGLLATLIGDALTLLPEKRTLYATGAFFLSHLLYTLYFASHTTLSFFWPIPLVLLVTGAVLITIIWRRLGDLRWPVGTFIAMTLLMVWLATEQYVSRPTSYTFTIMLGSVLLLLANIVWYIAHYRRPFAANSAIVAACYFAGHFMIVRSLYL